jgi:hypothetical protein
MEPTHQASSLTRFNILDIYNGFEYCPSALETIGIGIPARNIHNSPLFTCSSSQYPSTKRVSAANVVYK